MLDVGLDDGRAPAAAPSTSTSSPGKGGAPPAEPPTAQTTDPLEIPGYEIAAVAGYGEAPIGWVAAVPYAFRVLDRRRRLGESFRRVKAEREADRRAVQERMVPVVESIHDRHSDDEVVALLVRPIRDLLATMSERSGAMAQASEEHRTAAAALDAELEARRLEREQLQPDRRAAQIWVEEAVATQTRRKSDLARLGRELAAAHDAAAKAAGASDFAPPEHALRITELESRRNEATQLLAADERTVAEKRGALAAVEQKVAAVERAARDVQARRKALDQRANAERRQGEAALRSADHLRLDACEGALRRLVQSHPDRLLEEDFQRFEALDAELVRLARDVRLHELAVSAFDAEALKRGLGLVAGVLAALLLVVVLLARG